MQSFRAGRLIDAVAFATRLRVQRDEHGIWWLGEAFVVKYLVTMESGLEDEPLYVLLDGLDCGTVNESGFQELIRSLARFERQRDATVATAMRED